MYAFWETFTASNEETNNQINIFNPEIFFLKIQDKAAGRDLH
jgi:hypothetical protein